MTTCKMNSMATELRCTPRNLFLDLLLYCSFQFSCANSWYSIPKCKLSKWVLTQFTWCGRITNVPIRTSTNWLMTYYFAVCVSCTRISFSTRIDALSIFTCSVIWTIIIWCTPSCQRWWLNFLCFTVWVWITKVTSVTLAICRVEIRNTSCIQTTLNKVTCKDTSATLAFFCPTAVIIWHTLGFGIHWSKTNHMWI